MGLAFEWDPAKAASNEGKHGVPFEEAASVFANSLASIFDDPDHSLDEPREIIVGHSTLGRLLVVSYTERKNSIRIISARLATAHERRDYEERPNGRRPHD